jgi:hypothetical protein
VWLDQYHMVCVQWRAVQYTSGVYTFERERARSRELARSLAGCWRANEPRAGQQQCADGGGGPTQRAFISRPSRRDHATTCCAAGRQPQAWRPCL